MVPFAPICAWLSTRTTWMRLTVWAVQRCNTSRSFEADLPRGFHGISPSIPEHLSATETCYTFRILLGFGLVAKETKTKPSSWRSWTTGGPHNVRKRVWEACRTLVPLTFSAALPLLMRYPQKTAARLAPPAADKANTITHKIAKRTLSMTMLRDHCCSHRQLCRACPMALTTRGPQLN